MGEANREGGNAMNDVEQAKRAEKAMRLQRITDELREGFAIDDDDAQWLVDLAQHPSVTESVGGGEKHASWDKEPLVRLCPKCGALPHHFCTSLATMSKGDPLSPGHYHQERKVAVPASVPSGVVTPEDYVTGDIHDTRAKEQTDIQSDAPRNEDKGVSSMRTQGGEPLFEDARSANAQDLTQEQIERLQIEEG